MATTITVGGSVDNRSNGIKGDITYAGSAASNTILAGSGNDTLAGNAGDDYLDGGIGNDMLDGGTGADTLIGGAGNDVYIVDDSGDVLVENAKQGTDTIILAADLGITTFSLLGAFKNYENFDISLIGTTSFNFEGNSSANILTGNDGENQIYGLDGNDTLSGNAGDDYLEGGKGNDSLMGGADADTLDGGAGNDTMSGGEGDDLYVVDSIYDVISDTGGDDDEVHASISFDLSIRPNIEHLVLTGTGAISAIGNDSNNYLAGNTGNNLIDGGAGNDYLLGDAGNDTLKGGDGADTLIGGAGNDVYYAAANDNLLENASQGVDTIILTSAEGLSSFDLSYGSFANFENFDLSKTGAVAFEVDGNTANNILTGNDGANALSGQDGNDSLMGGRGNDTLTGGAGSDTLVGGANDDNYVVNLKLAGKGTSITVALEDSVVEKAGEGNDTLTLSGGAGANKLTTLTLAATLENLNATLVDSSVLLNLTGNAANNTIAGSGAGNKILGLGGDDILIGDELGDTVAGGNDTLDGGAGNDALYGGAGDDSLVGGTGQDTLVGGEGNDRYVVNLLTSGTSIGSLEDNVTEDTSAGTDTVYLIGNVKLSAYQMFDLTTDTFLNIEHLDISGTGSSKFNILGSDESNSLKGNAAANLLDGGIGNDTLDGAAGADTLVGGAGDDIYYVDNKLDMVTESADGGTDMVYSNLATYILADNVENLSIDTKGVSGTGNSLDNLIVGNAKANTLVGGDGNDTLNGGLGSDKLTGGEGEDIFVFDTALKGNIDTITDFHVGEDAFNLDDAIFGGLSNGIEFYAGTLKGSAGSDANIIYDNTNGKLYYDADGSGSIKAVQFATLLKVDALYPALSLSDFELV